MEKANKETIIKQIADKLQDHEMLVAILSGASYDSSWFYAQYSISEFNKIAEEKNLNIGNFCREDVWATLLLNGKSIIVVDCEEEEEKHTITLEDIEKAWFILIKDYPQMYANIVKEEADFYDYDALIQIAVFGEVVYG